jgi:glyoxylase-like metal-dependent hydrolase (beta-lactamase superfamily II)
VHVLTPGPKEQQMGYTGKVRPTGPAEVRELPLLIISKISVGSMDNNAYLLRCRSTGEQLLVDAANEPDRLLDLVGPDGLVAVVTTHQHADHWQGLAQVVKSTGARTFAHPLDAPGVPVETDVFLEDGDRLRFGAVELSAVHLVGHTPGSVALVYDDPDGDEHVFTGDCLFPGGVGRTTSPEDFQSLYSGVVAKIFDRLPDETWVYPGHGDDTTLGVERPKLPEWAARGW